MSDGSDRRAGEPITLAAALQGLPLPTPPRDGWPAMQRRLRRRRTTPLLYALAASLLLALTLGTLLTATPDAPSSVAAGDPPAPVDALPPNAPSDAAMLAALRHESAQLEALLEWSGDPWVDTGDSALLDQQLRRELQRIDAQLAVGDLPDAVELLLWAERVRRLQQSGELARARLLLADGGSSAGEWLLTL